jgi:PmbA protein
LEELPEIEKKALDNAQKLGTDEAEIYLYREKQASVKFIGGIFASRGGALKGIKGSFARIAEPWIKKKGVPMINSGVRAGVGIRAVLNKAIGFSSVSSLEEKKVLEATEQAVKIAKIRPPDPNWVSLPEFEKPSGQGGIFDKKVESLGLDEILGMASDCCIIGGDFDKRITNAMSMVFAASLSFGIMNTNGVEVYDTGTAFGAFMDFKAKSGVDEVSGGDLLYSRSLENLRPIALNAAKTAVEGLGRKPLPEKYVGAVVFENTSWGDLFSTIFTHGISALNVQETRSVYRGKIGEQVASEDVSVVDDGTFPEGFGTAKVDDEGVSRQKTQVVEKGVLRNFLYDNYSAKREQGRSTGNASRRRAFGAAAYANQPIIQPSNLMLAPGKSSLEEMLAQVKNGVIVKGTVIGAGHSNAMTGDFSVSAGNAFKIENGAIAYPLKPCTVAGNLYESLKSVLAVGNDMKCFGDVNCPSVVLDKIVVST